MGTHIRTERSDKKKRIYPYLRKSTAENLELIRQAVNTQKEVSIHDLAEDFLDVVTMTPAFINWIQDKYKVPGDHPLRVVPVIENNRCKLIRLFEGQRIKT